MASTNFTYSILTGAKGVEGSIRYWANHALVPADQILEEAQTWIYQRLRVREMRSMQAVSLAGGASSFPLPTGFRAPIKLEFNGTGKIRYTREDEFPRDIDSDAALSVGSPPSCWTVMGTTAYLDLQLDAALAGRLWCYTTPAYLSANVETNFLTDRLSTLLRRACVAYAYESRHRTADFQAEIVLAEAALLEANIEEDMSRHGQEL